jgi:hypothetical protein
MPAHHVRVEAVPHSTARSRRVEHLERSGMNRPTNKDDDAIDYEIRIKGHLDRRWSDRFEGLSMRCEPDGTTVLNGPVADQAALHGLLQRIRDMGVLLISVTQVRTELPDSPGSGARLDTRYEGDRR